MNVSLMMRREVGWLAFAALAVVSLPLACIFGGDHEKTRSAPAETTTTATAAPQRAFVRTCGMSIYGRPDAPAWRKHSIRAGPLTFYYADQFAQSAGSEFDAVPGRSGYYAGKTLLILVRRGAVATVVVPESERRYVALLYNPAEWNDRNEYRMEDGVSRVTFKACQKGETGPAGGPLNAMTQFNGSFLVTAVRCVPLDVRVQGEEQALPVRLSFGAGRCV